MDNPQGNRPRKTLALPFVYALLSSKEEVQYSAVLRAITEAANEAGFENCQPDRVMLDFELAIINSCRAVFPEAEVSCCFFHLKQNLYRKVQSLGLQIAYNDPNDREIKVFVHMTASLAYVPSRHVVATFQQLKNHAPACLNEFVEYFETTYVGIPARGRRAEKRPRYAIDTWNQYTIVLAGQDSTNNVSEGWHNRFRIVVAKHHPDLYSALNEFRKEQGDTEIKFLELTQGKSITEIPKKQWYEMKQRIRTLVQLCEEHAELRTVLDYLRGLAHTIVIN